MVRRQIKNGDAASHLGFGVMVLGMIALLLAGSGISLAGGAPTANPQHTTRTCYPTTTQSEQYAQIAAGVASVLHPHGRTYGPGGCDTSTTGYPTSTTCTSTSTTTTTTQGATSTSASTSSTSTSTSTSTTSSTSSSTSTTTSTTMPQDTSTSASTSTTTTTTTPVDTSSSSSSTSSTFPNQIATTSTVKAEGTTEKAGPPGPTVSAAAAGGSGTLPFTGSSSRGLVFVGLALLACGLGLVARRRRLTAD